MSHAAIRDASCGECSGCLGVSPRAASEGYYDGGAEGITCHHNLTSSEQELQPNLNRAVACLASDQAEVCGRVRIDSGLSKPPMIQHVEGPRRYSNPCVRERRKLVRPVRQRQDGG